MSRKRCLFVGIACLLLPLQSAFAQALEPRRWTHLPVGANFAGFAYTYADVDIAFDPALQIEDATADIDTYLFSYVRVLDVFGRSGRIDFLVPYSTGRWEGLLEGQPASTEREGFRDPVIRFAVNLLGSPAERGAKFRPRNDNTIVGLGFEISPPLGEYQNDKLINLGSNRWSFRLHLAPGTLAVAERRVRGRRPVEDRWRPESGRNQQDAVGIECGFADQSQERYQACLCAGRHQGGHRG